MRGGAGLGAKVRACLNDLICGLADGWLDALGEQVGWQIKSGDETRRGEDVDQLVCGGGGRRLAEQLGGQGLWWKGRAGRQMRCWWQGMDILCVWAAGALQAHRWRGGCGG